MIYVPFHIGDWQSGTRLMSPVEKGVYIDLIMYYYSVERPITQDECKRIARGYANADAQAMQYVLQNHFTREGDSYRHRKCDEVIASGCAISSKRSEAAKIRWGKERARRVAGQAACKNDANADANGHAGGYANAMLTSNHKPVTINKGKGGSNSSSLARVRETTPPELFDMPVGEADPDLAEAAAQTKRASTKKRGTQIPYDTLPDDWAAEAERIAPDLDARLCFEDFRDFALRDGAVYKDWTAAWRNNLRSMPEWKRVNFQKSKSYADLSHRVTRLPKDQRAQIWNEPDEAKQLALLEAFENGQNQL